MQGCKAMSRILIVDDDEDFLHLIGEYLKAIGLEHDLAVSAEQARNLLKRSGYDVVVSDFKMPGESGLDLLRYVSSMYPETRFILMTGCDDPRIKRESMRMGAHAYIEKPFSLNELCQTIINLVRHDDQKEVPAA
jgi:DNA-binding NtrC family response regulator